VHYRLLNLIGIALFRKLVIALKEGNIEDIRAEIVAYLLLSLSIWDYCLHIIESYSFKREKLLYGR
jgi:hypothetical protein